QVGELNDRVGDLEGSVQHLSDALTKLNSDPAQRTFHWDRLGFDAKLKIARDCDESGVGCDKVPESERKALLVRGEVRDAALDVGNFTATYVQGAAQIASNLGVSVPDWVSKGMVATTSAASLAAGIASGNPADVM